MPGKYKIIIATFIIPIIISLIGYFSFKSNENLSLNKIQESIAENNIKGARALINENIASVAKISQDWGEWTELYDSTLKKESGFIANSLGSSQMNNLGIDTAVILSKNNEVIFEARKGMSPEEKTDISNSLLKKISLLAEDPRISSGIFYTEGQDPIIFSFSQILKSDASGPAAGKIFFGKKIDPAFLTDISEVVLQAVSVLNEEDLMGIEQYKGAISALKSSDLYIQTNDKTIAAYLNLPTVDGKKIILKINSPADVLILNDKIQQFLLYIFVLTGILSGGIILISLGWFIHRKLSIVLTALKKPVPDFSYIQNNPTEKISELMISMRSAIERVKENTECGRYFSAVTESSDDAIIITDTEGTIQSWNNGALKTFGYSFEFAVGKNILFMVPAERKEVATSIIKDRILKGEGVLNYKAKLVTSGGKNIDVSINSTAVKDADGKYVAIVNIVRDTTKEKQFEDMLEGKIQELEKINNLMVDRELKIVELKKELEKYGK